MADITQQPTSIVLGGRELPLLDPTRIYVCGITPYDVTHLGHAATFVWVDLLSCVLRDAGVTPVVTRNVTDVDDVLTAAARRAGELPDRFAYLQQYDFDRDMAALNVRRPDHQPRARHYVGAVLRLARTLLAAGVGYEAAGSVYFPGERVAAATGLSAQEALVLAKEYGGRPDDPAKRHPLDAAIWQASEADEPAWPSPWGPGRPGWHAECAAMAIATYGPALDIHSGGADLAFPHHAFEAAIAEAVTGVAPFARSWFRAGIVGVGGVKMAKSTGNLVLISDLLAHHPASVIRLMLLDRGWSRPWDYEPGLLDAAAARYDALMAAAGRPGAGGDPHDDTAMAAVVAALRADLDVATALDIAIESGGTAARRVVELLRLL